MYCDTCRCRSLFLILVRKIIVHYTLREIRIFYFNVITKLNDLAIEALLKGMNFDLLTFSNLIMLC